MAFEPDYSHLYGPDPRDPGARVWETWGQATSDGLGPSPLQHVREMLETPPAAPEVAAPPVLDPADPRDALIASQQRQIEALERHIARLEAAIAASGPRRRSR
jgi:hypothetical protein